MTRNPSATSGGHTRNPNKPTVGFTINMPREMHVKVKAAAADDRRSITQWLLTAIEWHLKRQEINTKEGM